MKHKSHAWRAGYVAFSLTSFSTPERPYPHKHQRTPDAGAVHKTHPVALKRMIQIVLIPKVGPTARRLRGHETILQAIVL